VCADHVRRESLNRPALPEREALDVDVLQPPLGELLHHPVGTLLILRRACRARAEDFRQPPVRFHRLRIDHGFAANLVDGRGVEWVRLRAKGHANADEGDEEE
jgi:hypothetical protein